MYITIKSQAEKETQKSDAESLTSVTGRVGYTSYAFSHCVRRTTEDTLQGSVSTVLAEGNAERKPALLPTLSILIE